MEGDDAESFAILTVWWDTRTESVPEYQSSDSRGRKRKLERRQGQNDVVVICVVFCGRGSDTRYYGRSEKLEGAKIQTNSPGY